jgi:hypothetical protein
MAYKYLLLCSFLRIPVHFVFLLIEGLDDKDELPMTVDMVIHSFHAKIAGNAPVN